jgi:hypothetical protein
MAAPSGGGQMSVSDMNRLLGGRPSAPPYQQPVQQPYYPAQQPVYQTGYSQPSYPQNGGYPPPNYPRRY